MSLLSLWMFVGCLATVLENWYGEHLMLTPSTVTSTVSNLHRNGTTCCGYTTAPLRHSLPTTVPCPSTHIHIHIHDSPVITVSG